MKLSRLRILFFLHLQKLPMKSSSQRPLIVKWGGVSIKDYKSTFIGEKVTFDTNYPEDIVIEEHVGITVGCILLTHFKNSKGTFDRGKIILKKGAYLGANTIICKPVVVGERAIVGAGSIVTKDIPAGE